MPPTLTGFTPITPDPLVTFYDVATSERVELSGATTANWVAKVSNFLVDDLDAQVGTRLRIGIGPHWLRFVWVLAAWNVGAVLTDHDADIGLSGPDLAADEPIRLASALAPMGMRFATPPPGFLDIGVEVPGHGDHYEPFDAPGPDDLAWDLAGRQVTHREALALAGRGNPDRLLRTDTSIEEDALAVIAAILGGGSLVRVVHASPEDLARIGAQENARTP